MGSQRTVENLLRDRNLRATATRMDVLRLIADEGKAVSYGKIRDSLGHFDRVTLYRTLHTLVDQGVVHRAVVD